MDVLTVKRKGDDPRIYAVLEIPEGWNSTTVLKMWCYAQGLSEDAWLKFETGFGPVIPFSSLENARKPCSS